MERPSNLEIRNYYSQISDRILRYTQDREVVGTFKDNAYSKRPDIIQFKSDINQMVRKGICSFHCSVERWKNPMSITNENQDELRKGWDFLIDIDSSLEIDEAKIAAELIIKTFKKYGIKNYGLKFSGRRGFHLILPWEMFPDEINGEKTVEKYPEYPRILASFIRNEIKEELLNKLVKKRSAKELMESYKETPNEIDPYDFVDVEKDWGSRHMFRMPYAFNNKSWLVSIPLKNLSDFDIKNAEYKNVLKSKEIPFIKDCEKNEALGLLIDAIDWYGSLQKKVEKKKPKKIVQIDSKIDKSLFPPCMKNLLSGLSDGRKRSLFTLITFLRKMNWSWDEIEKEMYEWNKRNKRKLPENLIIGQIRWNKQNDKLPPNCYGNGKENASNFYSFACQPDNLCKEVKNPVNYSFKKMKAFSKDRKKKSKKNKQKDEPRIGKVIKKGIKK